LDYDNNGWSDYQVTWGASTDIPVTGRWTDGTGLTNIMTWEQMNDTLNETETPSEFMPTYDPSNETEPSFILEKTNDSLNEAEVLSEEAPSEPSSLLGLRTSNLVDNRNQKNAKVWYKKGMALEKLNRTEEANAAFVKAKELEDKS
jgi:hypothetical protein